MPVSASLAALGLRISFLEWENIEWVYVDGYDSQGKRVVRWRGRLSGSPPSVGNPAEYVLVPGEPSTCFSPVSGGGRVAIERLALFLQVAPEKRAGFILHGLEIAE